VEMIAVEKDVDGFHSRNMGRLAMNWSGRVETAFLPRSWTLITDNKRSTSERIANVEYGSSDLKHYYVTCTAGACNEVLGSRWMMMEYYYRRSYSCYNR